MPFLNSTGFMIFFVKDFLQLLPYECSLNNQHQREGKPYLHEDLIKNKKNNTYLNWILP